MTEPEASANGAAHAEAAADNEAAIAAAEAHTLRQWRIAGRYFGLMVAARVSDLAAKDHKEPADEGRLREISALVLSARRAMELEDRYEQKVQGRAAGAAGAADDIVARFDALAAAAGLRITRIDDARAVDDEGVSP